MKSFHSTDTLHMFDSGLIVNNFKCVNLKIFMTVPWYGPCLYAIIGFVSVGDHKIGVTLPIVLRSLYHVNIHTYRPTCTCTNAVFLSLECIKYITQ